MYIQFNRFFQDPVAEASLASYPLYFTREIDVRGRICRIQAALLDRGQAADGYPARIASENIVMVTSLRVYAPKDKLINGIT